MPARKVKNVKDLRIYYLINIFKGMGIPTKPIGIIGLSRKIK
jgi:hypothetical protein